MSQDYSEKRAAESKICELKEFYLDTSQTDTKKPAPLSSIISNLKKHLLTRELSKCGPEFVTYRLWVMKQSQQKV